MKKLLLVYLSAAFLFTMTSCLKKQDLSSEDLGPAIDPVELTKAMGQGYGSYDFNEMKKDEFTSVMYSWRIQESSVTPVWQQGITINQVANTVDSLKLDLIVQKETYSNGQGSQSTYQWAREFMKGTAMNTANAKHLRTLNTKYVTQAEAESPHLMFMYFQSYAFNACIDAGDYPQTCHNLTSTDVTYRVPPGAAAQHNCSDVTNCTVPAKKIEFDLLEKSDIGKDGKPFRKHYTMILSPHVPFMSRLLQLCMRGVFDFTGSNSQTLADVCYTVNNYASGQ